MFRFPTRIQSASTDARPSQKPTASFLILQLVQLLGNSRSWRNLHGPRWKK